MKAKFDAMYCYIAIFLIWLFAYLTIASLGKGEGIETAAHPVLAARYGCVEKGVDWEVRNRDGTRTDLLPPGDPYCYEIDVASKWAEAVGQSLHYCRMTERKPGVALIVPTPLTQADVRHVNACAYLCGQNGIKLDIWFYTPRPVGKPTPADPEEIPAPPPEPVPEEIPRPTR